MEPWLQSATGYIRDWLEFQLRASEQPGCMVAIAHRGKVVAEYAFGHANLATGEKLTPRHRLQDRFAFEEFHRGRNHEAARAAPIAARRSGRAVCQRPASAGRGNDHRASALAQRRPHPRWRRFRTVHRQPALSRREGTAGGAAVAARDHAQHPFQIFQPRLRTARPCDRSDHRGALSGLDRARDRRRRRSARDHARHARSPKASAFARGHTYRHSRRPAPRHSRRQCDPRHDAGRRLRQHGG